MKIDASTILPVLRSSGFDKKVGITDAFKTTAYDGPGAPDANDAPEVYFVADRPDDVAYLARNWLPKLSLNALLARSIENLRNRMGEASWHHVDSGKGKVEQHIWVRSGDDYAAEGLLLPEVLGQAHDVSDAKNLLACTPVRGQLCVCGYRPNDPTLELFVSGVMGMYYEHVANESDLAISPTIWTIKNKQITGRMEISNEYLLYLQAKAGGGK